MTDTNIIQLRPRAEAPVQPLPRSISGLRSHDEALGMEAAREADLAAQARIKALAREARNVFDSKHVCPSLVVSIANRAAGLAAAAEALAAEAKSLGLLKATVSLRDHAGHLERLAAELEADLPEGA